MRLSGQRKPRRSSSNRDVGYFRQSVRVPVIAAWGMQRTNSTCAKHGLQITFRINVHSNCITKWDLATAPPLSEHWHQTLERPPTNNVQTIVTGMLAPSSDRQYASNQPHIMQTLKCPHTQRIRSLSETWVLNVWQPHMGRPSFVRHG